MRSDGCTTTSGVLNDPYSVTKIKVTAEDDPALKSIDTEYARQKLPSC